MGRPKTLVPIVPLACKQRLLPNKAKANIANTPVRSTMELICGPCGEELKEGQPRYRKMKAHHACVLALKAIDRLGNKNPKVSGTKYKTYYIYISKALVRTRGVVALSIVR